MKRMKVVTFTVHTILGFKNYKLKDKKYYVVYSERRSNPASSIGRDKTCTT